MSAKVRFRRARKAATGRTATVNHKVARVQTRQSLIGHKWGGRRRRLICPEAVVLDRASDRKFRSALIADAGANFVRHVPRKLIPK